MVVVVVEVGVDVCVTVVVEVGVDVCVTVVVELDVGVGVGGGVGQFDTSQIV